MKMEKSRLKLSSQKKSNGNNNIYDIISYHEKEDVEPNHTKDVIRRIHRGSYRRRIESNVVIRCKLFGCLVMILLLSAPIYSYGTIYLQQKEIFEPNPALIFPPIIFNSVYLLVTPWLFNSISTPASRNSRKISRKLPPIGFLVNLTNKNIVITFSLILAASISIAGFTYTYADANHFAILIFYSVFGGRMNSISKFNELLWS